MLIKLDRDMRRRQVIDMARMLDRKKPAVIGLLIMALVGPAMAQSQEPLVLAKDSSFYVGGKYAQSADGLVIDGSMYVHALIPAQQKHPYPVVMIHGINSTGVVFEGTPDGREGWAQHFVRAGYAVYVIDQPARGRSPYYPDLDGPMPSSSVAGANARAESYTAPQVFKLFPQARHYTQWPSDHPKKGQPGDPVFDASMAGAVKSIPTNTGVSERLTKEAGAALLDRIGPAILLTHSQGGAFGWQIADARPALIKGIIAVEPALTPTYPATGSTVPAYGITSTPITYEPAVSDPKQLVFAPQEKPDAPDISQCQLQGPQPRHLPTLKGFPISVVLSEASPLTGRAHCVSRYLSQAGVANDLIRLDEVGIHGNGHLMPIERNNAQIADFLMGWLAKRGL